MASTQHQHQQHQPNESSKSATNHNQESSSSNLLIKKLNRLKSNYASSGASAAGATVGGESEGETGAFVVIPVGGGDQRDGDASCRRRSSKTNRGGFSGGNSSRRKQTNETMVGRSSSMKNNTSSKAKIKIEQEREYSEIINDENDDDRDDNNNNQANRGHDNNNNNPKSNNNNEKNDEDNENEEDEGDLEANETGHEGDENDQDEDDDGNDDDDDDDNEDEDRHSKVLFPGYVPVAYKYLKQETQPRYFCLKLITSPWFERVSMFIILINCITLGMYQPCNDNPCKSTRCVILQYLDHIIFIFFGVEMCIKLLAMGLWGKDTYLADTWNRLDMFIVFAGTVEYLIASENLSLSAIRTVRVLRPLRAINRVPSMRILVMLLLDTLPMLGNVLLLCFFVFFIFGIVGVQLWKGVLRNRCFFEYNHTLMAGLVDESYQRTYYKPEHTDSFICTTEFGSGMSTCADIPPYVNNSRACNGTIQTVQALNRVQSIYSNSTSTRAASHGASLLSSSFYSPSYSQSCINWNFYYSKCRPSGENPFKGAISFDNIGYAWVAIFQIISLESWVTIMYYIQDAHSFWNWIYFVFLIVIGSFFMINLCLVVIATQFSETKKRETERMIAERRRFSRSTSTLLSDSANEPGSCWEEFLKYLGHLWRKSKRRIVKKYNKIKNNRKKHLNDEEPTLKLRSKSNAVDSKNANATTTLINNENNNNNNNNNNDAETEAMLQTNNTNIDVTTNTHNSTNLTPITIHKSSGRCECECHHASNEATTACEIAGERQSQKSSSGGHHCSRCHDQHIKVVRRVPQRGLNLNDSAIMSASVGGLAAQSQLTDTSIANAEDYVFYCYSTAAPTGDGQGEDGDNNTYDQNHVNASLGPNEKKSRRRGGGGGDGVPSDDICCYCCCFCCAKKLSDTRVCRVLYAARNYLRQFVDGKFFQRSILFAILINTLSMGIEHHQQPAKLTLILEYSNIFFSGVFLLEMILKLLAFGIFDYIKSAFNLFDGAIVGISCYEVFRQVFSAGQGEVVSTGPSGVSVLRTFRLLRILKLVRFMPALRRQLLVMLKTIDNVATFFSLLILFIFIFSILGMNLFGCKFCTFAPDGERICERKNFDSLLWAIITVFQVLTQEDWNEVLYNSMEKTSSWAALYYIALMTFGNYVLFNLLVAILVEGFSTEDEPKKALEDRIIEDAIQAIAEEERQSRQSEGSRRGRSRKGSKISGSGGEGSSRKASPRGGDESAALNTGGSQNQALEDEVFTPVSPSSGSKSLHDKHVHHHQHQLPIIMHTGPTPIPSPFTSARNSPHMPRYRIVNDSRLVNLRPCERAFRKHSLDSSVLKHREIKQPNMVTNHASNRPTRVRRFSLNHLHNHHYHHHGAKTKPANQHLVLPTIKIDVTDVDFHNNERSNNADSRQVGFDTSQQQHREEDPSSNVRTSAGALGRHRVVSKSFNEKSLLAIPKRVYRHQRSKSEKSRSSSSKMPPSTLMTVSETSQTLIAASTIDDSPTNSPSSVKDESLESAAIERQQQQQQQPNNTTDRTVLIEKSPPYNVDIVLSNSGKADGGNSDSRKAGDYHSKSSKRVRSTSGSSKNNKDEDEMIDFDCCSQIPRPTGCFRAREEYSLYLFARENKFRLLCMHIVEQKWFDYSILLFISLNCITLAMERPNIPPNGLERKFLINSNYLFTIIFTIEMSIKVLANGFFIGQDSYLKSGWNIMDCFLVIISLTDVLVTLTARSSPKIFGILRVFRLLRTLRPLRMISRAPGLKLVVQTLLSSLRPIGNIVLICCTFFIIFGILGVQLFKGKLYRCTGEEVRRVRTREECLAIPGNQWVNSQYNFDNLGLALMALFVLSSKDGWVQIMYTGIDAVGIDRQPIVNYNEWMLLYFISFLLLVGFFVLNMFVGVVIENFHKCREEQEREEKARRAAKRAKKFEEKRRKMREIPYYASYSPTRRLLHDICNSKYFDLVIAGVIGLNVVSMSLEFYMMPKFLEEILDVFNFVFTIIFLLEAIMRIVAIGFVRYMRERWNQLDILIVLLSIAGIVFDKLDSKKTIPINPTIIRVMRVLRIARVLKLLKMAKGIRSLLDTVIQALPQVGNLGLLFFLLFFIFAILGVELFGRLNCESIMSACDGLSKHAHFHNFGMAFLTLFRIATGDNWNGIMKDTLRENLLCQDETGTSTSNMCLASILAPIYFVIFVLMAQFVLVNVVVAVLMKHLDESNKMMADDAEMDEEIERQLEAEARNNIYEDQTLKLENDFDSDIYHPFAKQASLPPNFTFDLLSDSNIKSRNNFETPVHSIRSIENESIDLNNSYGGGGGVESTTLNLPSTSILKKNTNKASPSPSSSSQHGSAHSTLKYKPILKHPSANRTATASHPHHHHQTTAAMASASAAESASISMTSSVGIPPAGGGGGGDSSSLMSSIDSRCRAPGTPHRHHHSMNAHPSSSHVVQRHPSAETASSTNLSIMNESDSVSTIMRMRQDGKDSRPYSLKYDHQNIDTADFFYSSSSNSNLSCPTVITVPAASGSTHFSPRSSMKIKVIDETETDN